MQILTNEQLLGEIEDLIRTMPPRATIRHDTEENIAWLGRTAAVVSEWNKAKSIAFDGLVRNMHSRIAADPAQSVAGISLLLQQARHELRLKTVGPLSVAVNQGSVFDYFDEIRKVIETAKAELFFIDPYIDSEFASRYLPQVPQGVQVRLLGRERMANLVPAVQLYRQQSGLSIEVRSSAALHDRFVFVDKKACYQSGASFKDGAKKSPTTLTQIEDAFAAIQATYEDLWKQATAQL